MEKVNGVEITDLGNRPTTGEPVRVITVNLCLKEYPWIRNEMPVLWDGFVGWTYSSSDTIDRGKMGTARLQTFITTNNTRYVSIVGSDEQDVMKALKQVESYISRLNEPRSCVVKGKEEEDDYVDFF